MDCVCKAPDCGRVIPPQQGSSRPRKYCVVCRPPEAKRTPHVIELGPVAAELPLLVGSYRARLESAGRVDCPEGAHVLMLAGLLAAGNHTASGAAALSRELRAAMEDALRGAPKAADWLDELAARRESKASGA